MLRRRTPLGLNARRRIAAGGPRAQGRQAASSFEWAAIREQVLARAGWRCQACGVRRRLDVHHVVKRSQGGSDFDLDRLIALCRWCHDQTDAPYERGRLIVTALFAGQFTFELVQRDGDVCTRRQNSPFGR
jgi:5-methylcytosine-specific restriction endonuclease McrA